MELVPIQEIYKILKDEPTIINKLEEFCHELYINPLLIPGWKSIRHHNDTLAVRLVLEEFVTRRGRKATIGTLCKCLENFECISGRGKKLDTSVYHIVMINHIVILYFR